MAIADINRLITLLHQSLHDLGARASMADAEDLAMVVQRCMGVPSRAYHDTRHVLTLCENASAVQVLAAMFHDTVYIQLDGSLPAPLRTTLADVIETRDGQPCLTSTLPTESRIAGTPDPLPLVAALFGMRSGQALPAFGGMNEFLSAVAGARLLAPLLPTVTLVHIAACIEATIPFRADDAAGHSALQRLHTRLLPVLQATPIGLDSEAARELANTMVADALALANRDVAGFAEPEPSVFLSQTWLLLEESNKPLAALGLYTIQEYRSALQRMDVFLAHLNPASVFQHYAQAPNAATLRQLTGMARANIGFAVRYLRAKLLAMAILEALALSTGGDAPIAMFLGEFSPAEPLGAAGSLPVAAVHPACDPSMLQVLTLGRSRSSAADLTASPTAAFIYRALGEDGLAHQWGHASDFFDGKCSANTFLRAWPRAILAPLLQLSAATAVSRQALLQQLQNDLLPD